VVAKETAVIDTGYTVTLRDGPHAGAKRPLLAVAELDAAPERLAAYRCSCCNSVVVMELGDPRRPVMGTPASLYRRAHGLNYVHEQ
jgi:hypothetical protein